MTAFVRNVLSGLCDREQLCRAIVLFTLSAFLHGCASQSVSPYASPPGGGRIIPRDIVVTAARFQPRADLNLLLRNKTAMAGAGAGSGAVEGAGVLLSGMGNCHDPYCGAAFLLLLPVFMVTGAVVGAVRESSSAAPAGSIARGQQAMQEGIARLDLQRLVQAGVLAELNKQGVAHYVAEEWDIGPSTPDDRPGYESVNPQHQDAILEISVLSFQFREDGRSDKGILRYQLSMQTRVRLLAPASRSVLDELSVDYQSDPHSAEDWLDNNAQLFETMLRQATEHTAQQVVQEMFLLYYPSVDGGAEQNVKQAVPDYVLQPVNPVPERSFDLRGAFADRYKGGWGAMRFVPMDSRSAFAWEAFPRPLDVAAADGQAQRFSDVRYEFAIYAARLQDPVYVPGALIYQRNDLITPGHRPVIALNQCGRYFWTVRARFRLDGWPRVTEWTGAYGIFAAVKPWEYRRGKRSASLSPALDPQRLLLPFRYGTDCR